MPNFELFERSKYVRTRKSTVGCLSVKEKRVIVTFGRLAQKELDALGRVAVLFDTDGLNFGLKSDPDGRKITANGTNRHLVLPPAFAQQFGLSGKYSFGQFYEEDGVLVFPLIRKGQETPMIVIEHPVDVSRAVERK